MAVSPFSQGPPSPGPRHTLGVGATSAHPPSCIPSHQPCWGKCSQYATPRVPHLAICFPGPYTRGSLGTTEFGGPGLRPGDHSLEVSWALQHPRPWAQVSPYSIPSRPRHALWTPCGTGESAACSTRTSRIPPLALHTHALTCSDGGPHSLSGPCCLPQPGLQAKTFLGWRCLRQQKVKTNLLRLAPSWACSSLRPQQTGQRPLAYPLQPFILPTLQMLARRGASPGWGRADSTLLLPRARRGAPTSVSQALGHTPCTTSWPHTKFLSGVSSILLQ